MVEGTIIKGIGGFFYVDINNSLISCKARGIFRKRSIKPLVGDKVLISIDKENNKNGIIEEIKTRKNEMKRPQVANIEQIIIVFAVKNPDPNFYLLDKLLIASEINDLKPIICFNKVDLIKKEKLASLNEIYKHTGYQILNTSKYDSKSIKKLEEVLKNKLTVFSGPSGVGKSSLLNNIQPELHLKTGDVSAKLKKGKHTTRHAEIMKLNIGGFVVDTPGFSSYNIGDVEYDELYFYFPDIKKYSNDCKFRKCVHNKEPGCSVKEALNKELININRYNNYLRLLKEIKNGGRDE